MRDSETGRLSIVERGYSDQRRTRKNLTLVNHCCLRAGGDILPGLDVKRFVLPWQPNSVASYKRLTADGFVSKRREWTSNFNTKMADEILST